MAVFSTKDFTAPNTLRIRNMIAAKLGVAAPATAQQRSDFLTADVQVQTREWEAAQQRAAVVVADPD